MLKPSNTITKVRNSRECYTQENISDLQGKSVKNILMDVQKRKEGK